MTRTVTLTLTLPIEDAQAILDLIGEPKSKPLEPAGPPFEEDAVEEDTVEEDEADEEDAPFITAKMIAEAAEVAEWRKLHKFKQSQAAQYFSPFEGKAIPACVWSYIENPSYHSGFVNKKGEPRRNRRRLDHILSIIRKS